MSAPATGHLAAYALELGAVPLAERAPCAGHRPRGWSDADERARAAIERGLRAASRTLPHHAPEPSTGFGRIRTASDYATLGWRRHTVLGASA